MAPHRGPDLADGRVTPEADDLRGRADEFARRVSKTIGEFTGTECPFVATTVGDRATIRHGQSNGGAKHGIPLQDGSETLLSLVVEYNCSWDSLERYLGVETSVVAAYPLRAVNKEPLFRYEFDRNPIGHVPCAHLQIHAHRDAFTHLLGWAGPNSRRARNRNGRGLDRTPSVSEFHFPLGGPRFRPALEDILDVLQEEFGLQTGAGWSAARDEARAEWRRTQVAAAVRDAPEEAARVLRDLGYKVSGEAQDERIAKLTML